MNKKILFILLLLGLVLFPKSTFAKEMTTIKSFGLPMVTDYSGDTAANLKLFGVKTFNKSISLGNDTTSEHNVVDESSLLKKLPKFVRFKNTDSDIKNQTFYFFYDEGELIFDKFYMSTNEEYYYQILIKKSFTNILVSSPVTDYFNSVYFYPVSAVNQYDDPFLSNFITSDNRDDYARISQFPSRVIEESNNVQSTEQIKNSSGELLSDANIKADIQVTYDENFVPENLGELVASIPSFLKDFAAAFSLVGLLFTSLLNSFPSFVVVGLYSVFGIGVLILLFKVLL